MPDWPTARLRLVDPNAPPEGAPFALYAQGAHGLRLSAVDVCARAQGLSLGQPLADARALVPGLHVCAHEEAADARALKKLARWCARWSPLTAPLHDGVLLDIAGVAHLFGDEAGMLRDMRARFAHLRLRIHVACADTIGAALALSRFHPDAARGFIAAPSAGLTPLWDLPVAALRLEASCVESLRAVGLKRIGDVARLSRASLSRRFGRVLMERLDQAAGAAGEPLDPLAQPLRLEARTRFLEPVLDQDALAGIGAKLAEQLCAQLQDKGLGVRRLAFCLFRVDGDVLTLPLGAARAQDKPAPLARLIKERLERAVGHVDLGFGIDAAALIALSVERVKGAVQDLDPHAARAAIAARESADFADRVAARFGARAVARFDAVESHIPERAEKRATSRAPTPFAFHAPETRPLFLLARPEPVEALAEVPDGPPRQFVWRRVTHRVARAEGPERIGAQWWRNNAPTRDYFRIETQEGRRLWLYREGLYGRETDQPRWFVQGGFG